MDVATNISRFVEYLHAVTLVGKDLVGPNRTDSKQHFEHLRSLVRLVDPDLNIKHQELPKRTVRDRLILCCPSDKLIGLVDTIYLSIDHSTLASRGWAVVKYAAASTKPENTLVFYPPIDVSTVRYIITRAVNKCVVVFIMADAFYRQCAGNKHLLAEARNILMSYIRALVGEYAVAKYVHSISIANVANAATNAVKPLQNLAEDILQMIPSSLRCHFCGIEDYRAVVTVAPVPVCVACHYTGARGKAPAIIRKREAWGEAGVPITRSCSGTICDEIPAQLSGSYRVADLAGNPPGDDECEPNVAWVESVFGSKYSIDTSESSLNIFSTRFPCPPTETLTLADTVVTPTESKLLHTAKSTSDLPDVPHRPFASLDKKARRTRARTEKLKASA